MTISPRTSESEGERRGGAMGERAPNLRTPPYVYNISMWFSVKLNKYLLKPKPFSEF